MSNINLLDQTAALTEDIPSTDTERLLEWGTEGIQEAVVNRYFQTLNAGEFEATAALFASDGALQPPFEPLVIGPEAIAAYLEQEAKGFILEPRRSVTKQLADGCTECEVVGKVQTPWFSVNVCWLFIISPTNKIFVAKVKLLASLQELLHLRR